MCLSSSFILLSEIEHTHNNRFKRMGENTTNESGSGSPIHTHTLVSISMPCTYSTVCCMCMYRVLCVDSVCNSLYSEKNNKTLDGIGALMLSIAVQRHTSFVCYCMYWWKSTCVYWYRHMVKGMLVVHKCVDFVVWFFSRSFVSTLISFARSSAHRKILVMCAILRKSNTYHSYLVWVGRHILSMCKRPKICMCIVFNPAHFAHHSGWRCEIIGRMIKKKHRSLRFNLIN